MLKRVKLKIESAIDNLSPAGLVEGDTEKSTTECLGSLRIGDGIISVTYTEQSEGGEIRSEIFCCDGSVRVRRSGAIESDIYFKEGEIHTSVYSISPYSFDAAVKAKRVRIDVNEMGGSIDLLYNMRIGGAEKSARMKIWILHSSSQN